MKEASLEKLKQNFIAHCKKKGDEVYMRTKKQSYTGNEMALELENETEVGLELMESMINLAAHLINKDKG